jgi:asparagine synthase (glutamine-hydrolysing)
MCGLSGEINFDGASVDRDAIARMTAQLAARGPDGEGVLISDWVGFGHRRLRIIDLSDKAAQPMTDPALGLAVVFNGCIYNYKALRAELQDKGYRFASAGDTEVILKAWHAWGDRCVERFHGMFAFVLHERESGRTVMARDRFGIKPLYLSQRGSRLRFASSLPALLAAGDVDVGIDRTALHHYMTFHAVVPAPHTLLSGVRKLPPATIRIYERDGAITERVYWRAMFQRGENDLRRSAGEWRELTLEALRLAVKRRMVADVPVGVLLSGGLDSSLIVALLAEMGQDRLNTFSVGFEDAHGEKGDEFFYSDIVAGRFGTTHHKISVPSGRLLDALPQVFASMSEPMVSYDNVGFFLLSQEVSKHVKVVQSGQGADEVFGGYHWYPPLLSADDPVAAYSRAFRDRDDAKLRTQLNDDWLPPNDVSGDFIAAHFAGSGAQTAVDKALRIDSEIMLVDDPVKRVDNMTMACGLEARVPFLDHELVELAACMAPEQKLKQGGKGVLKDAARQLLPSQVIDRPKGYFPVPALKYLDGPYLALARDALNADPARERQIFRRAWLESLFADPRGHITPLRGSELWQAATLELWLQAHGL